MLAISKRPFPAPHPPAHSHRGHQHAPAATQPAATSEPAPVQSGQTLRIWALAEDADQDGYNCGYGRNIWNNSEPDPAVLYDNSGHEGSRR